MLNRAHLILTSAMMLSWIAITGMPTSNTALAQDDSGSGQFCFIMLKPKSVGGGSTPIECFATPEALEQGQSAANARLAPQALAERQNAERQQSQTVDGDATTSACYQNGPLAYTWAGTGYTGDILVWNSYTCWEPLCYDSLGEYVFEYPYLPWGWNDRISSVDPVSSSGCSTRMWDNVAQCESGGSPCYFYPPVQTYCDNRASLARDNVTSAMSFRPIYWDRNVNC